VAGCDGLQLQHLYRAMAWLGEAVETGADGERNLRSIKDRVEEQLFQYSRSLFNELDLVLIDNTSLLYQRH